MPVAFVIVLLDITLIYHASRTGRLQPWAFIILMVPFIGSLAYIVVELVPGMARNGPGAQQARKRVADRLDPEKLYRELSDRLADTDTIADRGAAAECLKIGRFDEAERHYDHILKLPMGGSRPMHSARRRPNSVAIVRRCAGDAGRSAKALAGLSIGRGPSALCARTGRSRARR